MFRDDGLKAVPGIIGTISTGKGKAFSYVYADGSIIPAVMGGTDAAGQDGDANGGQQNAGQGGNGAAQKIEFTPEQQAHINTLFNQRFAEINAKAEARYKTEIETLKAQMAANRGDNNGNGGQQNAGQGGNQELKAALESIKAEREAEKAERAKERASALQRIKSAEVIKALGKYNVIDADSVAKLVDGDLQIDEGERITVKGDGGAKLSLTTGGDMTIDEYLSGWLKERQHFLRAAGTQGAGSQAAGFPGGGAKHNLQDPKTWREMTKEDFDARRKEGINVHLSSGTVMKFKENKNPFLEARKKKFNA